MIEGLVYILSSGTAGACAALLLRQYRVRREARLLLWSGICFAMLAVANLLQFADEVLFKDLYLAWTHRTLTVSGVYILIAGLIFDGDDR